MLVLLALSVFAVHSHWLYKYGYIYVCANDNIEFMSVLLYIIVNVAVGIS